METLIKGLRLVARGKLSGRTVRILRKAEGMPGFVFCALTRLRRTRKGEQIETDVYDEVLLSEDQLRPVI